ncbi:hypothetical protein JTE90_027598 [Oedothorax gibbosus]|uniref:Uncharacterized protein n=1 Tax=Oedothorax gibbosus TaxID=931172 RepID=A0AAV6VJP1_9ARAC|nr:hypothetical protein JTE90_027598 [Oedothorax gibbosus]
MASVPNSRVKTFSKRKQGSGGDLKDRRTKRGQKTENEQNLLRNGHSPENVIPLDEHHHSSSLLEESMERNKDAQEIKLLLLLGTCSISSNIAIFLDLCIILH